MKFLLLTALSTIAISSLSLTLLSSSPARAGQYEYCYNVKRTKTVSDPGSHAGAYNDGYREGVASASKKEPYQLRSAGGEFARGFDDGYYGRPSTGQENTIPARQETYNATQCQTYSYDDKDSINDILGEVLPRFQQDLQRDLESNQ